MAFKPVREVMETKGGFKPVMEVEKTKDGFKPVREVVVSEQNNDAKQSWSDVAGRAVSNIPKSAKENAMDMYNAVRHPINTAKGVYNVAAGGVQKLIPGEQSKEQYFDSAKQAMIDRYGSVEGIKETIAEDPVGIAVDVGSVLIPAGGAVKSAQTVSKLGKAGKVAGKIGESVQKVGAVLDPVNMVTKPVSMAAKSLIPKALPNKLYESAAKFSTVLTPKERSKLTNTAIKNNILPNSKGLMRIEETINSLNSQITGMIDSTTQGGKQIPLNDLFKNFQQLRKDAILTGKPIDNIKAINRVQKQIVEANKLVGRKTLSPEQAQVLKQNIYKDLSSYYSSVTDAPASIKAQQAVAKAAKESLEDIFPEIKGLNAKEGDMIALRESIQRSSNRIQNRDIIGIGTPIKGGAIGSVFGIEGATAGLALGILDTPGVKARLAIIADRLKNNGVKINPNSAAVRLGLIQAGRLSEKEK